MQIISDVEAIQIILASRGRFAIHVGAGVSAEAKVMTAWGICEEIWNTLRRSPLLSSATPEEIRQWENTELKWNDPAKRYAVSIQRLYRTPAARVQFFRRKLQGKKPSFSHHAIAMLMANSVLKSTCVTTNFDKLLESAFTQQGRRECQAIRNDIEIEYWNESDSDRCYVIKLHGDYDTYNILNTSEETISISKGMASKVRELLQDSGLVVLGTAGQEKSIYALFDELGTVVTEARGAAGSILSYGLLWGVYMGAQKPEKLTKRELEDLVQGRIDGGEVGRDIVDMMDRLGHVGFFRFFPVWGAGRFLSDLIEETDDRSLQGTADLYWDHEMRLRRLFARNLPPEAINKHLSSLDQQKARLDSRKQSPYPEAAFRAVRAGDASEVRILYGDMTKRSYMDDKEFQSLRRAVVSPEDTFLSAGGGVAVRLLEKAGPLFMLNELAKFAPIERGTVAVTSGGNLPVHHIFHAASIEIENDGNYTASEENVYNTMTEILKKAVALGVGALWVPLLGAGVASLSPRQSLDGILHAIADWRGVQGPAILIFIYKEKVLARDEAREALENKLRPDYTVEVLC